LIIDHIVKGSKNTSFHDFKINLDDMNLSISAGSYFRDNTELIKSENGTLINIPVPNVDTYYEVWLTDNGVQVIYRTDNEDFDVIDNPIDRLVWFTLPSEETDLNNLDIHFLKVVD
jgi:hypothetical protein